MFYHWIVDSVIVDQVPSLGQTTFHRLEMNIGTTSDLSSTQSPRSQGTRSLPGQPGYGPVDQANISQGWLTTADPREGRRPSSTQGPYSLPPTPSPAGTDLVLVSARNQRTEVSEVESSAGALTSNIKSMNNLVHQIRYLSIYFIVDVQ